MTDDAQIPTPPESGWDRTQLGSATFRTDNDAKVFNPPRPTTDELIRAIHAAASLGANWEPEHPQYVEGTFYLTQAQWDAIVSEFPRDDEPDRTYAQAIWGIPVQIVGTNDVVRLPSGKTLMYSAVMASFVVFGQGFFPERRRNG
ncbi:MAG: hypothetical protein VYA67_22075 [Actinomycetota bacterium]|nr:hypothetical protein [Actinomycetota bacterium]